MNFRMFLDESLPESVLFRLITGLDDIDAIDDDDDDEAE